MLNLAMYNGKNELDHFRHFLSLESHKRVVGIKLQHNEVIKDYVNVCTFSSLLLIKHG